MLREATPEEAAAVRTWFDLLEEGLWERVRGTAGLAVLETVPSVAPAGATDGAAPADLARDAPVEGTREPPGSLAGEARAESAGVAAADVSGDEPVPSPPRRPPPPVVAVLASSAVRDLPDELRSGDAGGGLAIGTIDARGFHIGLQGAVLMARFTRTGQIAVNEHAGNLFLYGRTILGTSILAADHLLQPGAPCIVVDVRGEALGVGRVVGNLKGKGEAVVAVHDLGAYLRAQGE